MGWNGRGGNGNNVYIAAKAEKDGEPIVAW